MYHLSKDILGIIRNYLLPNKNVMKKKYNKIIKTNIERRQTGLYYSIRKKHCDCYRYNNHYKKYYIKKKICKCGLKYFYDWYDLKLTSLSFQIKRLAKDFNIKLI